MAFSTRRGRPARAKVDLRDAGTPELQFKRALGLTGEPIDICLERGIITANHHWCGLHLRWLYTLRYGAPVVTARYTDDAYQTGASTGNPEWRTLREQEYQRAVLALQQAARYEQVMRLCVFNEIPAFLSAKLLQRSKTDDTLARQLNNRRRTIIDGLDILSSQWRRATFCSTNRI